MLLPSPLQALGWGPTQAAQLEAVLATLGDPAVPGRVVRQDRGAWRVQTAEGVALVRASGSLRRAASAPDALPVVGDWVALSPPDARGEARLHALLPRHSLLVRRRAGTEHAGQPLAANVDLVLALVALDAPLRPRRLERMLALARGCGASPVVVLTKTDLCLDLPALRAEAEAVASGAPVLAVGADEDPAALEALAALFRPERTGVFLGASGVGKSTLVNRLLGSERLEVGEVRASDATGRHTTTRRELLALPSGGVVIDTPGTRELGLWTADVNEAFTDVEALARECRFGDCAHAGEPGCAVQRAVEEGRLAPERLENWQQLQREQAWAVRPGEGTARPGQRRGERSQSHAPGRPRRR